MFQIENLVGKRIHNCKIRVDRRYGREIQFFLVKSGYSQLRKHIVNNPFRLRPHPDTPLCLKAFSIAVQSPVRLLPPLFQIDILIIPVWDNQFTDSGRQRIIDAFDFSAFVLAAPILQRLYLLSRRFLQSRIISLPGEFLYFLLIR